MRSVMAFMASVMRCLHAKGRSPVDYARSADMRKNRRKNKVRRSRHG